MTVASLGCRPGIDDRSSELCAQWASVDAARAAVHAAEAAVNLGWVSLAAGVLTLVAAGIAGWYARRAAIAALSANEIAGTGARAWLSLELLFEGANPPYETQGNGFAYAFGIAVKVQNHGAAPANDVRFNADVCLAVSGEQSPMETFCDDWRKRLEDTEYSGGTALFAGGRDLMRHGLCLPKTAVDAIVADQEDKWISPRIVGCVSYRTPHARGVRQTRFMAILRSGDRVIDTSNPLWWEGPLLISELVYIQAD